MSRELARLMPFAWDRRNADKEMGKATLEQFSMVNGFTWSLSGHRTRRASRRGVDHHEEDDLGSPAGQKRVVDPRGAADSSGPPQKRTFTDTVETQQVRESACRPAHAASPGTPQCQFNPFAGAHASRLASSAPPFWLPDWTPGSHNGKENVTPTQALFVAAVTAGLPDLSIARGAATGRRDEAGLRQRSEAERLKEPKATPQAAAQDRSEQRLLRELGQTATAVEPPRRSDEDATEHVIATESGRNTCMIGANVRAQQESSTEASEGAKAVEELKEQEGGVQPSRPSRPPPAQKLGEAERPEQEARHEEQGIKQAEDAAEEPQQALRLAGDVRGRESCAEDAGEHDDVGIVASADEAAPCLREARAEQTASPEDVCAVEPEEEEPEEWQVGRHWKLKVAMRKLAASRKTPAACGEGGGERGQHGCNAVGDAQAAAADAVLQPEPFTSEGCEVAVEVLQRLPLKLRMKPPAVALHFARRLEQYRH